MQKWECPCGYVYDPAEGDIANGEREPGCAAWQPFDVATDFDHIEQHTLQRRTDGEFAKWFGEFTIADSKSVGAGREVAAYGVDT